MAGRRSRQIRSSRTALIPRGCEGVRTIAPHRPSRAKPPRCPVPGGTTALLRRFLLSPSSTIAAFRRRPSLVVAVVRRNPASSGWIGIGCDSWRILSDALPAGGGSLQECTSRSRSTLFGGAGAVEGWVAMISFVEERWRDVKSWTRSGGGDRVSRDSWSDVEQRYGAGKM